MDKKYKELAQKIYGLADETKGPDKHIIQAMGHQVEATGDLDDQLEYLNRSIVHLNKTTSKLMTRQIWLILLQIIIAIIIAWLAIEVSK